MKHLKLFPKIFLYSLGLMLLVVVLAHGLIYMLAPRMQIDIEAAEPIAEPFLLTVNPSVFVTEAVKKALPISLALSAVISVLCSLLLTRGIVGPIETISATTERMMKLDKSARCAVFSKDEIGMLAGNINDLYRNLLSTIENLEEEKDRVSELERSKVDFLRAASHELKTPVSALNATLENMVLGVGKYRDYETYLPECKEMVDQLAAMIHEILDASKLGLTDQQEAPSEIDLSELITNLCQPYKLIAAARGIMFSLACCDEYSVTLPVKEFSKAISNILANAVAYTESGKAVKVYVSGDTLVIENECAPIPEDEIPRLFEPFYRPDFSRSRDSGGNGLGLYIVHTIFSTHNISYTFTQMTEPKGMRFAIQINHLL